MDLSPPSRRSWWTPEHCAIAMAVFCLIFNGLQYSSAGLVLFGAILISTRWMNEPMRRYVVAWCVALMLLCALFLWVGIGIE